MNTRTFLFSSSLLALPAFAADPRPPAEPIPPKIINVHQGQTYTIYCAVLMACSIQAPHGEKFVSRQIGDVDHFQDSVATLNAGPTPFYSIKPGFGGLATTVHLATDHE